MSAARNTRKAGARKRPLPPHKRPVCRRDLDHMLARLGKSVQFPVTLAQSIDTVMGDFISRLDLSPELNVAQSQLLACSTRLLASELRTVRDTLAILIETNARGRK